MKNKNDQHDSDLKKDKMMNRFLALTPALASANGTVRETEGMLACIELVRRSEGQTKQVRGTTQKRTARYIG